jgi:hypothetical protein
MRTTPKAVAVKKGEFDRVILQINKGGTSPAAKRVGARNDMSVNQTG